MKQRRKNKCKLLYDVIHSFFVCSFMKERERAQKNLDELADVIKLNVGGKKYETTKSSLLKYDNTFFTAMLSSGNWKPNAEGNSHIIVSIIYSDLFVMLYCFRILFHRQRWNII